jgi:acyl-CoA synthetase (NDP forming)
MKTASKETSASPYGFPDLERFFAPRSMAMLGATEDLSKFGGRCMRQLMDFGFAGDIYPINPKRDQVFGRTCFPSIAALPQTPDHVGIVLPAHAIPAALEQCAARGVPFATVFSSGFAETGSEEGRRLQQRIVDIARAGGMRLMGPNCNGMINFVDAFALTSTATISGPRHPAGDIGIVGQSGGAGQVNVMWRAQQAGLGISYQVSCGNAADIDLLDYAAFMIESPSTKVVLILAEHLVDGEKLRALARRAADLGKPLVMVKAGRTEAGSRAAASHTGAVTGEDAVCDAVLAQLGILRVDDYNDLYQTAMLLRRGRWPASRRAAAMSISGGNLVLLADLGAANGIEWPTYATDTQAQLGELLPGFGVAANPTDLTAAAIGQPGTFAAAAEVILADPTVDVMIPVLTIARSAEIRALAELSANSPKPMAILWTGCASDDPDLTPESLVAAGHAVYRDAMPCVKAVQAAMRYSEFRQHLAEPLPQRPAGIDVAAARKLLTQATGALSEHQSKALLRCYGLPITRESLANNADEAVRYAAALAGPVALKIQSPDLPHKTEAGAVRLNVSGDAAVRRAYDEVLAAARAYQPDARIEGVLVQEMIVDAVEMLVGITHDATFGPVMTIGLGGIFVEILKDVVFRLPPFDPAEALAALSDLRAFALLQGARGRPAGDIAAAADCIARISWLAVDLRDLIAELDVNPLCVLPQGRGVRIVDALVIPRQPGSME